MPDGQHPIPDRERAFPEEKLGVLGLDLREVNSSHWRQGLVPHSCSQTQRQAADSWVWKLLTSPPSNRWSAGPRWISELRGAWVSLAFMYTIMHLLRRWHYWCFMEEESAGGSERGSLTGWASATWLWACTVCGLTQELVWTVFFFVGGDGVKISSESFIVALPRTVWFFRQHRIALGNKQVASGLRDFSWDEHTHLPSTEFHRWDLVVNVIFRGRWGGKLLTFLCSLLLFSHWVVSAPRDCSTPGFSVHGIIPERILDWVAISSLWGGRWIFLTQGSNSHLLCLLLGRQILYHWAPGEAPLSSVFKDPKTRGEQVPSSEESRWTWKRWFSWGTVSPMKGSNTLSCYKCTEKELV